MIVAGIVLLYAVTPSRVCGLKLHLAEGGPDAPQVTPSRVCGLKLESELRMYSINLSHPHGCVD